VSFNDLLKQYQVKPEEPEKLAAPIKPAEPVKLATPPARTPQPVKPAEPAPTEPLRPAPVRPAAPPVEPTRPVTPPEPVRPVPSVQPKPSRPVSGAQKLLEELDQDVRDGGSKPHPVRPLRPGTHRQTAPRPRPTASRHTLPPYWYVDALLLGITLLAALSIFVHWDSVMDGAMRLIMTVADMAIVALIVLAIVFFVILMLRRRYRWRRWSRW